jgi:hypothetical protein
MGYFRVFSLQYTYRRKFTVWGISMMNPLIIKPCVTIIQPIAAPTDSAPILPQNICDGYFSNQKYAATAPVRQTRKSALYIFPKKKVLPTRVARMMSDRPGASPLKPECIFTRFATTGTNVGIIICR